MYINCFETLIYPLMLEFHNPLVKTKWTQERVYVWACVSLCGWMEGNLVAFYGSWLQHSPFLAWEFMKRISIRLKEAVWWLCLPIKSLTKLNSYLLTFLLDWSIFFPSILISILPSTTTAVFLSLAFSRPALFFLPSPSVGLPAWLSACLNP